MSIVARIPMQDNINKLELGWDHNRVDITSAPQDIQVLGRSICSFVKHSMFDSKGQIDPKLAELSAYTWRDVKLAVEKKQNALFKQFGTTPDHLSSLQALPWPSQKNGTKIKSQLMNQRYIAFGTGFAIGSGFVGTAAHVFAPGSSVKDCKAVFNLRYDGWSYTYDAAYDISGFVFHTDTKEPPNNELKDAWLGAVKDPFNVVNYWVEAKNATTHDLCVLELVPIGSKPWPPALAVSSETPVEKANSEIFTIGSAHGLPLIYTSHISGQPGPKVRYSPATYQNPVLTADIDTFQGNSGGPLLRSIGKETNVIGVVRLGRMQAWGSMFVQGSDVKNPLFQGVQDWVTKCSGKSHPISGDFLSTYDGIAFYDAQNALDWARYKPDSPVWEKYNFFNRADTLSCLVNPFSTFITSQAVTAAVPQVRLEFAAFLTSTVDPAEITVTPTLTLSNGSSIQLSSGPMSTTVYEWGVDDTIVAATSGKAKAFKGDLKWERGYTGAGSYTHNAYRPKISMGMAQYNLGDIPETVFTRAGGVLGWRDFRLTFSILDKDLAIDGGVIHLSFDANSTVFGSPDVFNFKHRLNFKATGDGKTWVAPVGGSTVAGNENGGQWQMGSFW